MWVRSWRTEFRTATIAPPASTATGWGQPKKMTAAAYAAPKGANQIVRESERDDLYRSEKKARGG